MDKTLLKGLTMIETLANSRDPRSISDLADELSLTKSNVHRILKTLESASYVSRHSPTGRYKLSIKIWELGSRVISRLDLKREALEPMENLSRLTRETVHLSVLDGFEVVYIDKIDSPEPIRAYSVVGGRAPAYAVATGKALLAFQPAEVIDKAAQNLIPFTENTMRNAKELSAELTRVRAQGYAVNVGEWRSSVSGIAAPIYGASGNVEAAIGISGPAARMKSRRMKEMVESVISAAETISVRLGYRTSL
jgi:DNA-binding IclR family transcriptional regulator